MDKVLLEKLQTIEALRKELERLRRVPPPTELELRIAQADEVIKELQSEINKLKAKKVKK